MRITELLHFGIKELAQAGVREAELDARILLEAATGLSRTGIFLDPNCKVNSTNRHKYLELLERRKQREPVAYILEEREFWSLPFFVSPAVLIPRPETEFLLDRVFALTDRENFKRGALLDLCCGSGVIAIVLAKETGEKIIASDISGKALEVAMSNVNRHQLVGQVQPIQSDLLESFNRVFSLIVSNPPYVVRDDVHYNLEPEVAKFEPHLALDGGENGLEMIKKIHNRIDQVLLPGGQFFMEIGAEQGEAVRQLFTGGKCGIGNFQQLEILKDYAGRDRVVHFRKA